MVVGWGRWGRGSFLLRDGAETVLKAWEGPTGRDGDEMGQNQVGRCRKR